MAADATGDQADVLEVTCGELVAVIEARIASQRRRKREA